MKTNSTQQEILIITGTSFSTREWCERTDEGQNQFTEKEQLQNACWNGLVQEMLPEICTQTVDNQKLWLWQVTEAGSFIDLELGEIPAEIEKYHSVNPYLSLPLQVLS
jgi:hypothetical protein